MAKKRKKSVPVERREEGHVLTIDMNRHNLKMQYMVPGFRTGGHMTEKDRPRKKNWKKEYAGA